MRKLVLIKHSLPTIDPARPANQWELGEAGRARCIHLARRLRRFNLPRLYCSHEPKARETAQLIAAELKVPVAPVAGLHEHERPNVPLLAPGQFRESVRRLFSAPDEVAFGVESGTEARNRFQNAVERLISSAPDQNIAAVSHGTVISLFVERLCRTEGFEIWRRLGLPSFVVLSLPDLQLIKIVEEVSSDIA